MIKNLKEEIKKLEDEFKRGLEISNSLDNEKNKITTRLIEIQGIIKFLRAIDELPKEAKEAKKSDEKN